MLLYNVKSDIALNQYGYCLTACTDPHIILYPFIVMFDSELTEVCCKRVYLKEFRAAKHVGVS